MGLPYAEMVAPLVLAGAGVSLAIAPTQSVVMTAVAPADIGAVRAPETQPAR